MAHARFVCEINDEYDFKGWRLKRHPTFFPVTPIGVAHDLLEHYPGDQGRVIEEIRAQGASAFVQVESGLMDDRGGSIYSLPEILAGNILSVIRQSQWVSGRLPIVAAPRQPAEISTRYARHFAAVEKYLQQGWEEVQTAVEHEDEPFTFAAVMAPRWNQALNALHEGYRWAARRYRNVDHAAFLFEGIEELSRDLLKMAEIGDEMVMHYMLSQESVKATLSSGGRYQEKLVYH